MNPASLCDPAVKPGDTIVGVNGKDLKVFEEVVAAIRTAVGKVELTLERQ